MSVSNKPTTSLLEIQQNALTLGDLKSLWYRLNSPLDVPHDLLRIITGMAVPIVIIIGVLRYDPRHPELSYIHAGNCFWALCGFVFAKRFTWLTFRFYMLAFACYVPLSSVLLHQLAGYSMSGNMLTVFTCFLVMLIVQTLWDYIIVAAVVTLGLVGLSHYTILQGFDTSTWLMLASAMVGGTMMGLIRQLFQVQMSLTKTTLSQARDEALAASQLKSQFLTTISHELRTPMNAIVGLTDLLLHSDLAREQRQDLELIKDSADGLLEILNDILDFAKIEANKLELRHTAFDLHRLVQRSLQPLDIVARQKSLSLSWFIQSDVPQQVEGDPTRLRQILTNLVGNAIKFTEKGYIYVHIEVERYGQSHVELKFSIQDTGVGIPRHKQGVIFDAFVQAEGGLNRGYGGTGLGLAISLNLVEMMKGRLWVESEERYGSTFFFTVTLALLPQHSSTPLTPLPLSIPPPTYAPTRYQILLAEDNPVNRTIAIKVLEHAGHSVIAVDNGQQAFEQMQQNTFDLILMDLQMPHCDGFQSTQMIRAWEKEHHQRPIPIIALTAHVTAEEIQRCLQIGMNAHLGKPYRSAELLELIQEVKENTV